MTARQSTLTLIDLVTALAGEPPALGVVPAVEIQSAVVDSRLARAGCLFVALRGEHHDGHDFILQAIEKGAVAVIAEKEPAGGTNEPVEARGLRACRNGDGFCLIVPDSLVALQRAAAYWRRRHDVRVIGVTGSVGKTTSKEIIAAVVKQQYRTLKSEGNYNNEIGLPLTLLHLRSTHERVVLEMGMYALGEISCLVQIAQPQVGVVTNIGPVHLQRLGTIERITQAKAELPRALPPAQEGGLAILNADDERVRAMAAETRARIFTFGLCPEADLWANDIESRGLEGIRFRFHHRQEVIYAQAPLLGRHSVHNALCAAAVGLGEGMAWDAILAGLQDQSSQLRLVTVPGPAGSVILDDTYNASPASCIAALNLLNELDGRKIAILGDMYELGSYTEEGHRLVGRYARDVVDVLVAVGPLGQIIGEEAMRAGMAAETVLRAESNSQAANLLRALVEAGDLILVKGSRGMGMESIVASLAQLETEGSSDAEGDLS